MSDSDCEQIPLESEHLIVFLDILGYKNKISDNPSENSQFIMDVEKLTELIKATPSDSQTKYNENVGVRYFSDNFLIYYKMGNHPSSEHELSFLRSLLERISCIQFHFLARHHMMIRGGITIGNFYANKDIVFGKGLVESYHLESKTAKYPRIVMDEKTFQRLNDMAENISFRNHFDFTIPRDHDEIRYLNYYRWICPRNLKFYDREDEDFQELWCKIGYMKDEL